MEMCGCALTAVSLRRELTELHRESEMCCRQKHGDEIIRTLVTAHLKTEKEQLTEAQNPRLSYSPTVNAANLLGKVDYIINMCLTLFRKLLGIKNHC